MDAYQLNCLRGYLKNQGAVKEQLEDAVRHHLREWSYANVLLPDDDVWRTVRVAEIDIDRLKPPPEPFTPEELEEGAWYTKIPPEVLRAQEEWDGPGENATRFVLLLDGPWHDGHQRFVYFLNEQLWQFKIDG